MERQLERRREEEPVIFERILEDLQMRFQKEQNLVASLPRVTRFNEVPWTQNAQAFMKGYTGHDIARRLQKLPIFSFSLREQIVRPGGRSGNHRHYPEALFYIVEGEGYEIHDNVKYPWEAGDIMCVPTYCIHQHFNPTTSQDARLFFSVPLVFELLGISLVEQAETHVNYQPPAGAQIIRGPQGEFAGYKTSDGLELKVGLDLEYQHKMETMKATEFTAEPSNTYDHYRKTLAEQTGWRKSIPHVVKGKEAIWENTPMGRIKYLLSPYKPSPLLLYDAYIQELPPGGRSGKHRHVAEEAHKILSGKGYDIQDGVRWDWEAEDVVVIPVNTIHQHFNADPHRPASFLSIQSRMYFYLGHGGIQHLEDAPDYKG